MCSTQKILASLTIYVLLSGRESAAKDSNQLHGARHPEPSDVLAGHPGAEEPGAGEATERDERADVLEGDSSREAAPR